MSGKDLKVALKITADLNQARREVKSLNEDIADSSKVADTATQAQQKVSKSSLNAASSIKKMSSATDMQDGIKQLNVYDKNLNQVSGSSLQFAQSNNQVLQSLKGFAPQLLSISAASAGFMAIAMDTVNKAAELKNQSVLGGLNVEEFQYYAAGAKTVGIQTEKLANIFKDTRDKIGDFTLNGGGELKDFFDNVASKVGVTSAQFKNLNTMQTLQLIYDTSKKAGLSDNEIVNVFESVADEATALIPLLEKSGEGFKKFGDKAKASGAILNQNMVNDAIAAKNAISDVQNQVTGLTNKMVANAAPAITFLAQNLDVLAQAGMIVGSVFVARLAPSIIASTQATIAEMTAKGQAIFMSKSRATALLVEANANQVKAATELKSAQTAAAVAMGSNAQAAAQTRLTVAKTADTAATLAQSRAQEIYNATMSRSRIAAGALLGALGGPVGLAITAAGIAASFMLMKDSTEQAAGAFDVQLSSVQELINKYKELNAETKQIYLDKLNGQLEDQESAVRKAANAMDMYSYKALTGSKSQPQAAAIETYFEKIKAGGEKAKTAMDELRNTKLFSDRELAKIGTFGEDFNKANKEVDGTKQKIGLLNGTNKELVATAQNVANGISGIGDSAQTASNQLGMMNGAYKDLLKTAQNNMISNLYQIDMMKKGVDPALATKNAKTVDTLNADPKSTQTWFKAPDELSAANALELKTEKERLELEQKITKEKEKKKEIAKQTAEINKTVLAQSEKYDYAGKEKNAGLPNGLLYAVSTRESGGNRFAKSPVGAYGAFQFMPKTAERFKLSDRTDVNSSAEAAAKYLKFLWEKYNGDLDKTIMAYNAGEGNVDSGKAYSFKETQKYLVEVKKNLAAINGFKDENAQSNLAKQLSAQDDTKKKLEQKKQERVTIDLRFATEPEKLKKEYDDLVKDINQAGYDPDTLKIRLVQAEQEYQDKLSKRPEILKRVQESLSNINKEWLTASGNDIDAKLMDVDEKWKQPKADVASLLMSESNPIKANEYQNMLVKIDFIVDQEKLTLQYNNAVERFKQLDELRNSRLENLKTQFDSGQITQPQYAEQAKEINSQLRPEMEKMVELAWEYADAMQGVAGEKARADTLAIQQTMTQTNNEFRKFIPTAEQLNEQIAGGLTDSIMAWADGTKSAGEAFKSFASDFLREIAQMILKQMLFNAISTAFGGGGGGGIGGAVASGLSAAFSSGFSSGGYTGVGGKYDPAGLVHKDEFVIRKESTSQVGAKEFLSDFNRYGMSTLNKFKGYADGGLVGAPNVSVPNISTKVADPAAMIANSTSFSANQNFYLVDDPARVLDVMKSNAAQENLVVMISRDPSKFKSALKLG